MDVVVVGRHTKVTDDFRTRVADKAKRVETVCPDLAAVEVHVLHNKSARAASERERVEMTVRGKGPVIRAEASAEDRHVALDLATDRVVERLRKRHDRHADRRVARRGVARLVSATRLGRGGSRDEENSATSVETWDGAPDTATREIPLDGTPIVIRSKTHVAIPMTVAEAIDQMELVGHDFFLFHDAESGLPSAVYRRRGWTYGVIHLERASGKTKKGA